MCNRKTRGGFEVDYSMNGKRQGKTQEEEAGQGVQGTGQFRRGLVCSDRLGWIVTDKGMPSEAIPAVPC